MHAVTFYSSIARPVASHTTVSDNNTRLMHYLNETATLMNEAMTVNNRSLEEASCCRRLHGTSS